MRKNSADDLVKRIKSIRKILGLTQVEFAARAGIRYKHYQAIEGGRKIDIRLSTLEKLAKGCELPLWKLFYLDPDE